jgi:hypothetical protein
MMSFRLVVIYVLRVLPAVRLAAKKNRQLRLAVFRKSIVLLSQLDRAPSSASRIGKP